MSDADLLTRLEGGREAGGLASLMLALQRGTAALPGRSGRDCLQLRSTHTLVIVPSQVPTFDCFISSALNQCVVTDFVSV